MAQIERGEARIQRRISIKKALDTKVSAHFNCIVGENCTMVILALYRGIFGYNADVVFPIFFLTDTVVILTNL